MAMLLLLKNKNKHKNLVAFNFSRNYFKAANLKVIKTDAPKAKIPKEKLVFGRTFTDHMLIIEWNKAVGGWGNPLIKPFGPLTLQPSASVLHYATECFEGMKAYRDAKSADIFRLFRPEMNMERFNKSAVRLSLPDFDENELLKCIKRLVRMESDWIPEGTGYSLYIRPTMIATNECIGISQPDRALLYVICSPVGPYFQSSGFSSVKILAEDSFVRAWPGGTGEYKIGANYGPTLYPQRLALERGFQQILWLLGPEHEITEIGSMNCFIFMKDQAGKPELITPPLLNGTILPGVTRDSILNITRSWNEFKVSERTINMAEFIEAHSQGRIIEMFGSGTAAIVSPIKLLNFHGKDYEIPINDTQSLAQRLFKLITKIQYGEIEHEWSVKF